MSPEDPVAKNIEGLPARSRKVFLRNPADAPIPHFTNAIEFVGVGLDVFMDIGVVPPETIIAAIEKKNEADKKKSGTVAVVDMGVTHRFALTIQTAMQMHQKLTVLLNQSGPMASIITAKPPKG